ncbi:MAG: DUF4089 domain-containing protein [Janthinobacterium lividum]
MTDPEPAGRIAQAIQAARFLGIPLDPAHLDRVAANLELLESHASRVMALVLPHDIEPAPVFVA